MFKTLKILAASFPIITSAIGEYARNEADPFELVLAVNSDIFSVVLKVRGVRDTQKTLVKAASAHLRQAKLILAAAAATDYVSKNFVEFNTEVINTALKEIAVKHGFYASNYIQFCQELETHPARIAQRRFIERSINPGKNFIYSEAAKPAPRGDVRYDN